MRQANYILIFFNLSSVIYNAVYLCLTVCLFVCPIKTHEPLNRSVLIWLGKLLKPRECSQLSLKISGWLCRLLLENFRLIMESFYRKILGWLCRLLSENFRLIMESFYRKILGWLGRLLSENFRLIM